MAATGEKTLEHSELKRSLIGAFHCAFIRAFSLAYSFQNKDGYPLRPSNPGDPGADSWGEGKSKQADKIFRPLRLSLAPTIYPWVSQDESFVEAEKCFLQCLRPKRWTEFRSDWSENCDCTVGRQRFQDSDI